MKRLFLVSVFTIGLMAFISRTSLAQSTAIVEPTESQQESKLNDATPRQVGQSDKNRNKTIFLDSTLNEEVIKGTQEVSINLGQHICGDLISVTWTINNPLNTLIEFPRTTSSCGCVSELPKSIAIPSARSEVHAPENGNRPTEVGFKITMPRQPEKLVKHIAFWDVNGNARLHLTLEADAVSILKLDSYNSAVVDESQSMIRVPFESEVEVREPTAFRSTAVGMEVKSSQIEWLDTKSGELVLGIDTVLTPQNVNESSVSIAFEYLGKFAGEVPFKIYYPNRVVVIPKEPVFGKSEGSYKSRFLVRSSKMADLLRQSNKLKASMIDGQGKKLPTPVNVESTISNPGAHLVNVVVEFKSSSVDPNHKKQTLRFVCGEWEQNIAFRYDN